MTDEFIAYEDSMKNLKPIQKGLDILRKPHRHKKDRGKLKHDGSSHLL